MRRIVVGLSGFYSSCRVPSTLESHQWTAHCPMANKELSFTASTGAVASDMESHFGARVAANYGLPFAACRVVLNPMHRKLPAAALRKLKQGSPDLHAILRSVMGTPSQVRDLMWLILDASIATACLWQGRLLLGPNLGFPEAVDESLAAVSSASIGLLRTASRTQQEYR